MILETVVVTVINILGTLIGLYCIYVSIAIYQLYNLKRIIYFIFTAVSITLWNLGHLILGILSSKNMVIATIAWYIVIGAGIFMVINVVLGYHLLRFENLKWRVLLYVGFVTFYMTIFYFRPDIISVEYNANGGWQTVSRVDIIWGSFSVILAFVILFELEIPMIKSYLFASPNIKKIIIILIVGITMALFSNSLLLIKNLPFPAEVRFLVADIGFLIFFRALHKYPFIGIYDNMIIHQVIVANMEGDILHTIKTEKKMAILTSGAIIGVHSLLENTSFLTEQSDIEQNEFRRIELGPDHYFTASEKDYMLIFHYSNTTGVGIQKLKSLSRIFRDDEDLQILLNRFNYLFEIYFPLKRDFPTPN